jgi:murein DD-endopeptidase MepM/ murein hydrolase activator NlpD
MGPLTHEAPLPPPVRDVAPEAFATMAPDGPPIDPALIRFAGEARSRRAAGGSRPGFPVEAERAWGALGETLDAYLARPLPQTPLLELVRARVTLDTEWELDQRRYGAPPAELAEGIRARASRLALRIQTSRALGQTMFVIRPPGRLRWPIPNAGLSSGFGMRDHPLNGTRQLHAGIDLVADLGRVVSAAGPGYVVSAGWAGGYGLLVEVRHPGELTTRYGHLSALLCAPGDPVELGKPLGTVGLTGLTTGPHLHFEVWEGGQPRDPLVFIGGGSGLAEARR